MAKKSAAGGKGKRRRKYAKPRMTRHGELTPTALAQSY